MKIYSITVRSNPDPSQRVTELRFDDGSNVFLTGDHDFDMYADYNILIVPAFVPTPSNPLPGIELVNMLPDAPGWREVYKNDRYVCDAYSDGLRFGRNPFNWHSKDTEWSDELRTIVSHLKEL